MVSRSDTRPPFPWLYVLLTFGVSWSVWGLVALASHGVLTVPLPSEVVVFGGIALGAFGPLLAALVASARDGGRRAVRALLGRVAQRVQPRVLLLIVALPLVLAGAARTLAALSGSAVPPYGVESPLTLLPIFVFTLLFGGPLQEEFGWRGYALDRLRATWGDVWGSLILGGVWTVWHLPLWWIAGSGMAGTPPLAYAVYTVSLTLLFTWVHVRAGGSLLAAVLLHTMVNVVSNVFPTHDAGRGDTRAYALLAGLYALTAVVAATRLSRHAGKPALNRPGPVGVDVSEGRREIT